MNNEYRIVPVKGHYEVYWLGQFLFSADDMREVMEGINQEEESYAHCV